MLKPRYVLGKRADGKLVTLHLSEDAVAAKAAFSQIRSAGQEGILEIAFYGPWGPERHYKFRGGELKPAKAARVGK